MIQSRSMALVACLITTLVIVGCGTSSSVDATGGTDDAGNPLFMGEGGVPCGTPGGGDFPTVPCSNDDSGSSGDDTSTPPSDDSGQVTSDDASGDDSSQVNSDDASVEVSVPDDGAAETSVANSSSSSSGSSSGSNTSSGSTSSGNGSSGSSSGDTSSSSSGSGSSGNSSGDTSSSGGGSSTSGSSSGGDNDGGVSGSSSSGSASSSGSTGSSSGGSTSSSGGNSCPSNDINSSCTYTQGYWKNHASKWPVTSLCMGGVTYTEAECLVILNESTNGNACLILESQLIPALLNGGVNDSNVSSTVVQANAWLANHPDPCNVASSTADGQVAVNLASTLATYNNGNLGTPHCL